MNNIPAITNPPITYEFDDSTEKGGNIEIRSNVAPTEAMATAKSIRRIDFISDFRFIFLINIPIHNLLKFN